MPPSNATPQRRPPSELDMEQGLPFETMSQPLLKTSSSTMLKEGVPTVAMWR